MKTENQEKAPPPIHIVSGGKGLAGDAVVQSILIQFPNNRIPLIIEPNVLNEERVQEVVKKVLSTGGVIVHTMVNPDIRKILIESCEKNKVIHFDLVGGLSDYLSNLLNTTPISKPGLYRLRNLEYFKRVEAIDFTLKCDDGQNPDKITNADIVLTGVSRTGKTPLSVYLAMFGWKVANVPLVPGIPPPDTLFKADKNRVFGLNISMVYLIAQRGNRVKSLNMPEDSAYIDRAQVRKELDYADSIFKKGDFTVISITNKPVESSANEILTILTNRFSRDDWRK